MLRSLVLAAAAVVALWVPSPSHAQYGHGGGGILRCESIGSRDQYCQADTRNGVQLLRTLSRTPCSLGQSWGYDRGGVWVTNGCRAEFQVGSAGSGYGYGWGYGGGDFIVCASRDYRHEFCAANIRGTVEIVNQISRTQCIEGRNWGYDRRGIWVDKGCAGEFRVRGGRGGGGYRDDRGGGYRDDHGGGYEQGYAQTITCESRDRRRQYCPANLRGQRVELIDNLSRTQCEQGYNWDYDAGGVWVTEGCRATFSIEAGRRRR
jgi:hypothetical protein